MGPIKLCQRLLDLASKKPGSLSAIGFNIIQNGKSSSEVLKADDKVDLVFSLNLQGRLPRQNLQAAVPNNDGGECFCVGTFAAPSDASAKARC